MARKSIKTLVRNNLPYGRYRFMITLVRSQNSIKHSMSNASQVEALRPLLRESCQGKHRLVFGTNWDRRRVYTRLYLEHPMDVAMIKLTHNAAIHKIYKIKVEGSNGEPA